MSRRLSFRKVSGIADKLGEELFDLVAFKVFEVEPKSESCWH